MSIQKVGALGAGAMGSGIAYACAMAEGVQVAVYDSSREAMAKAKSYCEGVAKRAVDKGKMAAEEAEAVLGKIQWADSIEAFAPCDLIIEAASENLELKKRLFAELDRVCGKDAILGTNTSSLSITSIAAQTSRPEQVIGIHFFNPAPVMTLVELIRAAQTSDATLEETRVFCEGLGKTVVEAKDSPGFITTRVGIVMMNEAIFLLAEGVGTAEDIDEGVKRAYNHPMGPLALADLVGLDIVFSVMNTLYDNFQDPKYRPSLMLRKMVEAGRLGRKSGKGFYDYS